MNGIGALLVVGVLLVAGAAGPATGAVPHDTATVHDQARGGAAANATSSDSAEPSAPGAHLSGVVDVQEAEIEGELVGRAFGLQVASARSNASKAAVVAAHVGDMDRRTDELRERKRRLVEARRNGTISQARFRAEMAALAARTGVVAHHLDRTEVTARDLPPGLLESEGVDATKIATLRNDTRAVSGRDVAAIARSIAGPNVGGGLAGNASADPSREARGQSGLPNATPGDERTPNGPGIRTTSPGLGESPGADPSNGTAVGSDAVTSILGDGVDGRHDGPETDGGLGLPPEGSP